MKLSFVSLILSAGLAISQASAAPARITVLSGPVDGNGFVRVGKVWATPFTPSPSNVVTMHYGNKTRHGCAGSFRAKAMQLSNWFRHTFGLPPVNNEAAKLEAAIPVVMFHGKPPVSSHHVHHSAYAGTFVQRLTRALMMLGPWEGRAVSFILGCGIGVLIRMFWVLAVLAIRSTRGNKREEEFLGDEVIYEEGEHLLPPQYVETETVVKEKSEPVEAA